MTQTKTSWLRKAAAAWGVLLAISLVLALTPATAWAATVVNSVTINGLSVPSVGDPINFSSVSTTYTPASASSNVSGCTTTAEVYEGGSYQEATGNYEAGKTYRIVIEPYTTENTTVCNFGPKGAAFAGSVTITGGAFSVASTMVKSMAPGDTEGDQLFIYTNNFTMPDQKLELPKFLSDSSQTWTKGSDKSVIFKTDADFETFRMAYLDDTQLEEGVDYKAYAGSTVVELLPTFLNKLDNGTYDVTIISSVGNVTGSLKVQAAGTTAATGKKSPKTGVDATGIALAGLVFALGAAGAGSYIVRTRKEN